MSKKLTHIGVVKGSDVRVPDNYQRKVLLRETKLFWITKSGTKFKKHNGMGLGDWPMYYLDLDSIKEYE